MPRVAYTAEVTQEARKSADEIARRLDELLGDRWEQWTLVIRQSFDDPDLRVRLRQEQGSERASLEYRFAGDPDRAVEPVLHYLRSGLAQANVLEDTRRRAPPLAAPPSSAAPPARPTPA